MRYRLKLERIDADGEVIAGRRFFAAFIEIIPDQPTDLATVMRDSLRICAEDIADVIEREWLT